MNDALNLRGSKSERELDKLWAKTEVYVELLPHVFRRTYDFDLGTYEDVYPLSVLCALKAPQASIQSVHKAFPGAVVDAFQVACVRGADFSCIKWLYELRQADDSTLSNRLMNRWLGKPVKSPDLQTFIDFPLHLACRGNWPLDVVKFVVDKFPEQFERKDEKGLKSPLHLAFEHSSLPVIKHLLELDHSTAMLLEKDAKGDTPPHFAWFNQDEDVAEFVANEYPDSVKQRCCQEDDMLPLHAVCCRGSSEKVVRILLEMYPEAAKLIDDIGDFPLQIAYENSRFKGETRDAVLELLIRANPDALNDAIDHDTTIQLVRRMATQLNDRPTKMQKTCDA